MATIDNREFKKLEFDVEVSTWYHEYRRGALGALVTSVRLVSLLGSVGALLAISTWVASDESTVLIVATISVVVGVVNLFDLVFQFDARARAHWSLYERFKTLQAEMARGKNEWQHHLAGWEATAQSIRVDEPPTYWALYNLCRNQTLKKHGLADGRLRRVAWWQSLVRNWLRFEPDNFEVNGQSSRH